jgi:drug/metabolite transporter (DMT)-like permease
VLALLGGSLAFSLMTVCVRQLRGQVPVAEVVLGRAVVSLALSAWLVRRAGLDPWGRRRRLLALRGLVGTTALACVYQAVMVLPLATATVLQYLYPAITALLAWSWLGEKPAGRIGAALALAWLGVVVISRPPGLLGLGLLAPGMPPLPLAPLIWALAGALLTSVAYVSVRELARTEHPQVIVLWFPLMALPLSLPAVLMAPVLPSLAACGWLVAVGVLTQLGQIGLTEGLRRLPAAQATLVSTVQVAFAALWGWLVFAEPIDPATAAGAGLILASILVGLGPRPALPPPLR